MGIKNSEYDQEIPNCRETGGIVRKQLKVKMHCKEQRRIIPEIYMLIFQSRFDNPPYSNRITEKGGILKNNNNGTSKFHRLEVWTSWI